jgi:hypothetical protein
MVPLGGSALEEVEVGLEVEPLDWVLDDRELEEKRSLLDVKQVGVIAGVTAWGVGVERASRASGETSFAGNFFVDGLAIRNIDFQPGVDGVVGEEMAKSRTRCTDAAAPEGMIGNS